MIISTTRTNAVKPVRSLLMITEPTFQSSKIWSQLERDRRKWERERERKRPQGLCCGDGLCPICDNLKSRKDTPGQKEIIIMKLLGNNLFQRERKKRRNNKMRFSRQKCELLLLWETIKKIVNVKLNQIHNMLSGGQLSKSIRKNKNKKYIMKLFKTMKWRQRLFLE